MDVAKCKGSVSYKQFYRKAYFCDIQLFFKISAHGSTTLVEPYSSTTILLNFFYSVTRYVSSMATNQHSDFFLQIVRNFFFEAILCKRKTYLIFLMKDVASMGIL